jgi:hypothetical protein
MNPVPSMQFLLQKRNRLDVLRFGTDDTVSVVGKIKPREILNNYATLVFVLKKHRN